MDAIIFSSAFVTTFDVVFIATGGSLVADRGDEVVSRESTLVYMVVSLADVGRTISVGKVVGAGDGTSVGV